MSASTDRVSPAGRRSRPAPDPQLEISEADFLALIVEAAALYGWQYKHDRPARTAHGWRTAASGWLAKGWPDLVLVNDRNGRMILAELKSEKGRLTADQERVHAYLGGVSRRHGWLTVAVWRPSDWALILEILQ